MGSYYPMCVKSASIPWMLCIVSEDVVFGGDPLGRENERQSADL